MNDSQFPIGTQTDMIIEQKIYILTMIPQASNRNTALNSIHWE
jgi:hypothetical protein